jgi:hypothetical protein
VSYGILSRSGDPEWTQSVQGVSAMAKKGRKEREREKRKRKGG